MAKLTELADIESAALGFSRESARSVILYLRPAGLIQSAGRGRNAADMTPADAAALLVGLSHFAPVREVAVSTKLILDAQRQDGFGRFVPSLALPPFDFLSDLGEAHTFGQALVYLIEEIIHAGGLFEEDGFGAHIQIKTTPVGYEPRIRFVEFDDADQLVVRRKWDLHYLAPRPEFTSRSQERWGEVADGLEKRNGRRTVTIGFDAGVLYEIADCLRGGPLREGEGEDA